jgi:hypothetical protein
MRNHFNKQVHTHSAPSLEATPSCTGTIGTSYPDGRVAICTHPSLYGRSDIQRVVYFTESGVYTVWRQAEPALENGDLRRRFEDSAGADYRAGGSGGGRLNEGGESECAVHEVLTPPFPVSCTVWVWRVSQGGVRVCTSGAKTKELSAVSFECERVWGLGGTRPICRLFAAQSPYSIPTSLPT